MTSESTGKRTVFWRVKFPESLGFQLSPKQFLAKKLGLSPEVSLGLKSQLEVRDNLKVIFSMIFQSRGLNLCLARSLYARLLTRFRSIACARHFEFLCLQSDSSFSLGFALK